MSEHPLVELYIDVGDDQQNASIEQMLSPINLDKVILDTLHEANITEQIMLTVLITNDDGIRDLNQQYRQQNKPTDVLSFPLLEKPLVNAPLDQLWSSQEDASKPDTPEFVAPPGSVINLGDIMMSWPTIVQQAKEAGHHPIDELLYLLSHGVLHLIGYDDQTEAGYQAMVRIQQFVLQLTQQV